jgi:hypothetical protein
MPNLDLDRYPADMRALAAAVTDAQPGARRVQRTASTQIVDVDVISGTSRVTVLLQESGLYVKGFRNANGAWYFKGSNGGANELKFSCSYVGSNSLEVFSDPTSDTCTRQRGRVNLDAAITTLSLFRGGNDLDLKTPLATMAFIVSEAIRFTNVYYHVTQCCAYKATFSFLDLKDYVQNWQAISEGKPPAGVVPGTIFTSHG